MLEKIKNPYVTFFLLWLLSIGAFAVTKLGIIAAFSIFYTGVLPFIYLSLWFSKSEVGQKLREHAKKWHIAIWLSWIVFAYAIYSQKWASNLINEVFNIDAGNLSITYTLLAFLFTPFGMLYQESVVSALWNALVVTGIIWGGIVPLLLMLPIPMKKVGKIVGVSFLVISLSSFFIGVASNLALNKKLMVQGFALWADFNANHMCTDKWALTTDSVLFLGGERVLIYQPNKSIGSQFSAKKCNFEKSF